MKATLFRVLIGMMIFASLTTVSFAQVEGRGLGDRPPTAAEQAYIDATYSQVNAVAPNSLSRARAQREAKARGASAMIVMEAVIPAAVDNSIEIFFPPIRSQGSQGSCTAWASAYYYDTYTQAKDEGYSVSGGDNDHICSPAFIYPLINGGYDGGASTQYAVARLNDIGCCSWTLKPYSSGDYTTWPSEAAWINALQNRTQTSQYINGSNQSGVDAIKQHLANGNIAVTSFSVYQTWYNYYPADRTGYNNGVYYAPDGNYVGGHAVTLVGYDDNKSYVDHRDGQTHYGAFLLANSWSSSWGVVNSTGAGTKGFFWVAYSMFLNGAFGPWAYYNSDRAQYRPALYAVAGINHSQRGNIALQGLITDSPGWVSEFVVAYDGGSSIAITDTSRVAIDLTDGLLEVPPADNLTLGVALDVASGASASGTITSADFFQDLDGDGAYTQVSSTDPVVTVAPGTSGYAFATLGVPAVPAAPSSLTATVISASQVNLHWQDNSSNETGFIVERKLGAGGTYGEIATLGANTTSWSDSTVTTGNTYYYRLKAYLTDVGESGYSNEASATPVTSTAPSNLTARITATKRIMLSWQDNSGNETNFIVERKIGLTGTYSKVATLAANTVGWTTSVSLGKTYYYRVRAYTAGIGYSDYSNEACMAYLLPAAPSSLAAEVASSSQIDLSWVDNSNNEAGFKIERKTGARSSFRQIAVAGANATTWSDTTCVSGITYYYRIRAYADYIGNSKYSNSVSASIPGGLLGGRYGQ